MKQSIVRVASFALVLLFSTMAGSLRAQVTTATLSGTVSQAGGAPLGGVSIVAVHQPSGTRYTATTRQDGRYSIPGMRVGGPYRVSASLIGRQTATRDNITLTLGVATPVDFSLAEAAVAIEGITATAEAADHVISPERTGAATSVTRETIEATPTISGRIEAVARLTPQYSGGMTFGGQDNRLNNITVDGSYFNNSFGLGGQPGDRTGVAPISLQAIEQVQINIAPYDVRQGNFVGAGVNTVTRSGTNEFRGSIYHQFRDEGLVGTEAGSAEVNPGTFNFRQWGGWLSGPIIRDRLFFFANYENDKLAEPGTIFRARAANETVGGSVTRVLESDLTSLSEYLRTNFDYETGPFQGYEHATPATRALLKLDYNINDNHKLSFRYNHLDSNTDVLVSTSSSLGFGRGSSVSGGRGTNFLNFQNSNYQILENIRSFVGEWNARFGDTWANNLIAGYTFQDESRDSRGTIFPFVDILSGGSTYTSFGFEPFTPNNELRYKSYQFQNNLTRFGIAHTLTFGISAERYESENVFFPGSQSSYVYNSLQDFYTDANDFLANPNRTSSPVALRRFQVRWSNIPGQEKPIQPLEVLYGGIYGQDEWAVRDNLRLTFGARIDVPWFGDTGFHNPAVDAMTFEDENEAAVQYRTDKLPDPNPLFSPRFGFNWDVRGDANTQVRGGTGVVTGRPAYVWISNQIGENGILTGFEQRDNIAAGTLISAGGRPFNPNPDTYKPSTVSGAPASSYALALTDPDFKFPQVWRSNLAVDQRLPFGLIGTAEFLYSRDVNGVYYINANLSDPTATFSGPDNRPRWTGSNRINSAITSAIVLKNQNEGYSYHISGTLERPFTSGLQAKVGYAYGVAKNTIDPGSVASGSWTNNPHSGDPNNPGVAFSANSPGHRMFGSVTYRTDLLKVGNTSITLYGERRTAGNASYVYSGDLNGDGGTSNDLLYIPADASEMNFQTFTQDGVTFTAAAQAEAFERFIQDDPYLREHRGQYAERGAAFLPMTTFFDLNLTQDIARNIAGRRNALQFRVDVQNFGNLLNSDWGVGRRFVSVSPLVVPTTAQGGPADAQGRAQYRLRVVNGQLVNSATEATAGISDVYRVQFTLRYTFN